MIRKNACTLYVHRYCFVYSVVLDDAEWFPLLPRPMLAQIKNIHKTNLVPLYAITARQAPSRFHLLRHSQTGSPQPRND